MKEYNGYLKPHEKQIRDLAGKGVSPMAIARVLFAQGVRSPYLTPHNAIDQDHIATFGGLIRHMLGLRKKKGSPRS